MDKDRVFAGLLDKLEHRLTVLPDKNEETPHNTLAALWLTSIGMPVSAVGAENSVLPALSPTQLATLERLIQERLDGTPLSHLTMRQNYMSMEFVVNKGLYIPRKETELLAKVAISHISQRKPIDGMVNVIDVCCGIGTVALAIAKYVEYASVFGSDIFEPAIACAQHNASNFELTGRSTFLAGDLFEPLSALPLRDKTHLVVSAPPYISSAKVSRMAPEIADHEPKEAFDAGAFGFSVFLKLISIAPEYLEIGGYLIFECGLGQGEFLAKRIRANQRYGLVSEIKDENGDVRVLLAQCVA